MRPHDIRDPSRRHHRDATRCHPGDFCTAGIQLRGVMATNSLRSRQYGLSSPDQLPRASSIKIRPSLSTLERSAER
jgi:hypothetical protein